MESELHLGELINRRGAKAVFTVKREEESSLVSTIASDARQGEQESHLSDPSGMRERNK